MRSKSALRHGVGAVIVLATGACGTTAATPAPPSMPPPSTAAPQDALFDALHASCASPGQGVLPQRASLVRQGSAVALVRDARGKRFAYVADADSRSIHTVSLDDKHEVARTSVDGAPRELLVLPDGRVAATLSDAGRVAVLAPSAGVTSPMATLCARELPTEPWGLALSPSDADLVVTSGWGAALSVLDPSTLASRRVVALPRDPRDVVVDASGRAFVSHLVGAKMSVVSLGDASPPEVLDLGAHKATPHAQLVDMIATRTGSQGFALAKVAVGDKGAERILAPMVSVDPGDPARERAVYYGPIFDGVPKEAPFVAVVDPQARAPLGHTLLGTGTTELARECLLPRAAAVRQATGSLLVACFGIDALVDLDAFAADPFRAEKARVALPPGPSGVAVDDKTGDAIVFSQMGGSLSVVSPDAKVQTIALEYHPDEALARATPGRLLFYRTDDLRISGDGLACASCHIDGRDDAITWTTPQGPRQTPMLAGRLVATAPYGWEGARPTLHDYVSNTVSNLGGKGLAPEQLDQLSAFLFTLKGPPEAGAPRSEGQAELLARGRALFEGGEQSCSSCHSGTMTTDASRHALGYRREKIDTPSLRFLRGTGPYFHDGRYATLEALLADSDSGMGSTAKLPAPDRAALAAYLRSM